MKNNNPSGLLKSVGLFVAAIALCAAQTTMAGVSGFVDTQISGGTNATAGTTASNTIGFGVADGAVYLSKELGKGKVLVDLPFKMNTLGATDLGLGAAAKAQAYVNFGYDFGMDWTLGRFDSPFVNESNDSVDLAYAFQSGLYALVPHIHQGLMLNYANSGFSVKALVSNSRGAAVRATAEPAGQTVTGYADNYEYGVLAKYTHESFYVGAGYYLHKPAGGADTGSLIDFNAGTKMNDLTLGLNVVSTKAAAAGIDSGFAVAASVWYAVNKTWGVGLRPEYMSKALGYMATATTGATYSQFQVTAGSSCALTDDLKVRLNYVFASSKANSGTGTTWTEAATSTSSHGGVLSAAYRF